jgi:hypothetical protein
VSNSCLDHVYTTHPAFISVLTVPNIGLADHLPVFICRKYVKTKKDSSHKVINYHDFKNLNVENFLEGLHKCPWDNAFIFDDVLDLHHIPWKQKRVKRFKQPAWINDEIVVAIGKRDQDYKRARKSIAIDDWANYKRSKCHVVNLIKKSKHEQ